MPAFAVALLTTAVMFRQPIASGLEVLTLDAADGRLLVVLAEHWWQWVQGEVGWRNLPAFYPVEGVFGYSDAFFVHGMFQIGWRSAGLDRYLAFQLTILLLHVLGMVGFYLVGRRLGLSQGVALAAMVLAGSGAPLFSELVVKTHAQLSAVHLTPWVVLGVARSGDRRHGWVFAGVAGLLLAAIFLTGFYAGWYFVFFCGLCWMVAGANSGKPWWWIRTQWSWLGAHRRAALAFAIGFGVGLVPFVYLYLPVLETFGSRSYASVLPQLPRPVDLVNVSPANLLWGSWFDHPALRERDYAWELDFGFPPVTVALFVGLWGWLGFDYRRNGADPLLRCALIIGTAVLVAWLLMLRVGDTSLWRLVHALVPGASSIRAVFRFNVFLALPLALFFGLALQRMVWRRGGGRAAVVVASLLLAGLALEQLGAVDVQAKLHRSQGLAQLAGVHPVPVDARWFLLAHPGGWHRSGWDRQAHAMEVAQVSGVPTINGLSGQFPSGWQLAREEEAAYYQRAQAWIEDHTLEQGYLFEPSGKRWLPYGSAAEALRRRAENRHEGADLAPFLSEGWSGIEDWGVWSEGERAQLRFRLAAGREPPAQLHLLLRGMVHPARPRQVVDVLLNDCAVATLAFTQDDNGKAVTIKPAPECYRPGEENRLTFVIHTPFSPADVGANEDRRRLGLGLRGFAFD